MYSISSFFKSEIKNNYEFTDDEVNECNIKFYEIRSLFGLLLKDYYSNKFGGQHVERFNIFADPFNKTLKTYLIFYHIIVDLADIFYYKLNVQVTSNSKTYIHIENINISDNIKHEAGFEIEDFDKISFDETSELSQTFKYLIESFNK